MVAIINFGKTHKGKSLPEVVLHDPDWFFWAMEEDVFDRTQVFAAEAHDLDFKARNIKIPKPNPQDWCIRYVIHASGKFERFDIVEATERDLEDFGGCLGPIG